eukprot:GHVU01177209.1.p1 GENE.GHVU01177209.1~~GHVU01177209.1.p1  ORF type:complete len:127 (-),score=11.97 GHVU01177209.1:250-630(-)
MLLISILSSMCHQKQHQRITASSRSTEGIDLAAATAPSCGDDDHADAQSSSESDGVWCEYVCVVTCAYPRLEMRPQTSHSDSPSNAAIGNTRNGTSTFDDGGSRSDTAELLQHHIVNRSVGRQVGR